MRLTVSHVTRYSYDSPIRRAVQSLRMTPPPTEGQRILRWHVGAEGALRGASFRDGAGDTIETLTFHGPLDHIEVRVEGEVETRNTAGVLRGHAETVPPRAYLRRTPATTPDAAIRDLAGDAVGDADASAGLDRAHALSSAVTAAIAFRPGETQQATTAAEALKQGSGVCQDLAHLLISAARCVDLPARYVAGYLHAGEGASSEAAHAWAEIHVEGLGWVGFDPTNACCPDERYIRVGSGLDSVGAAPVRGHVEGLTEEHLDVSVAVGALQSQTQGPQGQEQSQ